MDSTSTLIPPAVQLGSVPLVGPDVAPVYPVVTLPLDKIEEAMVTVRRSSYEEGYKDGHQHGYNVGYTEGWRRAINDLHKPEAVVDTITRSLIDALEGTIVVKDKDALGHGSNKRGVTGPHKPDTPSGKRPGSDTPQPSANGKKKSKVPEGMSKEEVKHHKGAVGRAIEHLKGVGSAVLQTKVARFLIKAEHKLMIVAHKTRDIAEAVAKRRNPPLSEQQTERLKRTLFIADFVGGYATGAIGGSIGGVVGAKIGMLMPSASALYVAYSAVRNPAGTWAAAREVVANTFSGKGHKALDNEDTPDNNQSSSPGKKQKLSDEQLDRIAAEVDNDWKEAVFLAALGEGLSPDEALDIVKDAGAMPDELPTPSAADFGGEEDQTETKAIEVVWLLTAGVAVNAEELQYKDTDGAEDGLNDERREDDGRPFNPLEVPPIAVWRATSDDQIYVVDGHKRLATARKRGVPNIRAFFIEASSFAEAKKKGEQLNKQMGTKAFEDIDGIGTFYVKAKDAKGHEHRGKGPGGGQFVSTSGGGGGAVVAKKKQKQRQKGGQDHNKGRIYSLGVTEFTKSLGLAYEKNDVHINRVKAKLPHLVNRDKNGDFITPSQTAENEKNPRPPITKKGAYVNQEVYMRLRQKAATKIRYVATNEVHRPTKEEKAKAKADIAKIREKLIAAGKNPKDAANIYRKNLNGNNDNRRQRKVALAAEFGDGETCGCPYCGVVISYSSAFSDMTMEEDKIIESAEGGKYKMANLIPSCVPCNRTRGDMDAAKFLEGATYGAVSGTNAKKTKVKAFIGQDFLDTLDYPEDQEFPYPAHDTGIVVTAMAYTGNPWDEEGKSDDPVEVIGTLLIRPSPFGGLQCFVLVEQRDILWAVDPDTVEPFTDEEKTDPKPIRENKSLNEPDIGELGEEVIVVKDKDALGHGSYKKGEGPGETSEPEEKKEPEKSELQQAQEDLSLIHTQMMALQQQLDAARKRVAELEQKERQKNTPPPSPPKAPTGKREPLKGGTLVERLNDMIRRESHLVPDEEVDAIMAEVAKLPEEKQKNIAREVTGKGGRNAKQAQENIRLDLTAVKRVIEGQRV